MKYLIGVLTAALTVAQAHAATIATASYLPVLNSIMGRVHYDPPPDCDPGVAPEPATWGLMIVGFVLLAVALRARRKVRA
jgi:PEP-CTERM motif